MDSAAWTVYLAPERLQKVDDYIKSHWDESVHDDLKSPPPQGITPIPFPHTVPCLNGHFRLFFYWDTYFTNLGLISHGRLDIAKSNCRAMAWFIDLYGFVPNDSFKSDSNRSQPPYFALMVRDIHEASGDSAFLAEMLPSIRREHQFWMNARWTNLGLNRHGEHATREFLLRFYDGLLHKRLDLPLGIPEAEKLAVSSNYLAEAETGWDFNPRFEHRCLDFCPVDLNSNLWAYEKFIASSLRLLGSSKDAEIYEGMASHRAELMRKHLWSEARGLFLDFDFKRLVHGKTASLASFHPLWAGLASKEEAHRTAALLGSLEEEWGPSVCERAPGPYVHQWGYPNAWPPLVCTAALALERYGLHDDAERLASKYLAWCVRHFEATGQLWEKFDARSGEIAGGEYEAQPMLGWSAGVFVFLASRFKKL